MFILEIFLKRRKFMTIFDNAWPVIGKNLSTSQGDVADTDPQLELFYFSSLLYCSVYHAALSAGMSTSSAHYLARNQTNKSKIDSSILLAAQEVFAAPDDATLQQFAGDLDACVEPLVAAAAKKAAAIDEAECRKSLVRLHQSFQRCGFSAEQLFLVED